MTAYTKIPPHAVDIEMSVLGSMILSAEALDIAMELLVPEDFFKYQHQEIFKACHALYVNDTPIDLIILTEYLHDKKKLLDLDGAAYLSELCLTVASPANCEHHARIVLQKSKRRRLIHACERTMADCYEESSEISKVINQHEQDLFDISLARRSKYIRPMSHIVNDNLTDMENVKESEEGVIGVPTGYAGLNRLTSGWQPGDMIIIASRPSMGKTAFALQLAKNAAEKNVPVAFFSIEMPDKQLGLRLISSSTNINMQRIRTGKVTEIDMQSIMAKIRGIADTKIYVDDSSRLTPAELRGKTRRLVAQQGVGLVVVDYLQLMQPDKWVPGVYERTSQISNRLKGFAKDMNLPLIVLAQLNRDVDDRKDHVPVLSDLRGSGDIEQDADVVIFLYRPGIYSEKEPKEHTIAILAKQRQGIANVTLDFHFNLETGKFTPMIAREEPNDLPY